MIVPPFSGLINYRDKKRRRGGEEKGERKGGKGREEKKLVGIGRRGKKKIIPTSLLE